jgi:hypothetical protein
MHDSSSSNLSFLCDRYKQLTLLHPHQIVPFGGDDMRPLRRRIAVHLATQLGIQPNIVMSHLPQEFSQWGRVQIKDGDLIRSLFGSADRRDVRDATFIQYEQLVDRLAHNPRAQPEFVPHTFFGQLERIVVIGLPASPDLKLTSPTTYILFDIKPCNTTVDQFGFQEYRVFCTQEVIDGTAIRAVVGRLYDRGKWVIVKRSGGLEHADFILGVTGGT